MEWTAKEMGRKGGKARAARLSRAELAEIGRKGGQASARARRKSDLDSLALRDDTVGEQGNEPGSGEGDQPS